MTNRKQGLTIIELIVVMCIVGVMALMATPHFGPWISRYRLRGAIREVASMMQLARMGAIRENRPWAIQFNTATQTYTVLNDPGGDGAWGTGDEVGYKGDGNPWNLSTTDLADYHTVDFGDDGHGPWLFGEDVGDGVTFAQNRVLFNPNGTAGPVGSVYLENTRGDASSVAGIRSNVTGVVEVRHWDGIGWNH